jgi:hypothetical protein
MVQAAKAATVAHADTLLDQVTSLHRRSLRIMARAERAGDLRTALAGVREARGCVELLARMEGQLARESATINVLMTQKAEEADYSRIADEVALGARNILLAFQIADGAEDGLEEAREVACEVLPGHDPAP